MPSKVRLFYFCFQPNFSGTLSEAKLSPAFKRKFKIYSSLNFYIEPKMSLPAPFSIRKAECGDSAAIAGLIRELAEFEKLADQCHASAENVRHALFSDKPAASALVLKSGPDVVGYAIYFFNYSTFTGKRGLYLEDLYIREAFRGRGFGRAMLSALAEEALANDCARMDWTVLAWNEPAKKFYEGLAASILEDWRLVRLEEDGIAALAQK